jgi:hypothetical protein
MKKSQRASETQSTRNLKQSITNIRKEISPVPTVSSIGSNPRAVPLSKSRWLRRSVRVTEQAASGSSAIITFGEIGTAMGATGTESYAVKVLGIKAWNTTGLATTSNSILVQVSGDAITAAATGIQGEDFGCGQSLPGVKINIPDLLAATVSTSTTLSVCTLSAPGGGTAGQNFCVDFDIMYQM